MPPRFPYLAQPAQFRRPRGSSLGARLRSCRSLRFCGGELFRREPPDASIVESNCERHRPFLFATGKSQGGITYRDCKAASIQVITDAGHTRPGTNIREGDNSTPADLPASELIWDFFKAHPKQ